MILLSNKLQRWNSSTKRMGLGGGNKIPHYKEDALEEEKNYKSHFGLGLSFLVLPYKD